METLTDEQRRAFDAIKEGKSVFITGPGGTGKSYLLKMIYDLIPEQANKHVAVTAMTGCASILLGRHVKTLHSWAGIGLAKDSVDDMVTLIRKCRPGIKKRWLNTDILVIDEISMMDPGLLEKLDAVAKGVRKSSKLMGGLQVVFVGDFYQLPPVNKSKERDTEFLFESPLWDSLVQETIQLTKIYRQQDPVFQKILVEARRGELSEESTKVLESRMNLPWKKEQIKPTLLFTRRNEVNQVNEINMKRLTSERRVFEATISLNDEERELKLQNVDIKRSVEKMDRDNQYEATLVLAIGAQVMLLTNLDFEAGLVNGSRGIVTGFTANGPLVKFKLGESKEVARHAWESNDVFGLKRLQFPLRLAYAITIHKSQGSSLDCALIDIGTSIFETGQAYVALSRVRSLEGLYVWDIEATAFRAHPKVVEFYDTLHLRAPKGKSSDQLITKFFTVAK